MTDHQEGTGKETSRKRRPPRLHHVTVSILPEDISKCVAFYTDVLQLTPIDSPVEKAMWFAEGVHLYWGVIYDERRVTGTRAPRHLALEVGDRYREIVEHCQSASLFLGKGTPYWGSPRSYVVDPAGNRIELMEFAPQP